MGWTYTHRERGMSTQAFFEREFPDTLSRNGEILASAVVSGTFYAAVKDRESGNVWAMIALTGRSRDYHNFGYKEMDEAMGPSDAQCPARVLDLLSPLPECAHTEDYCRWCTARIWSFGGDWVSVAHPGQHAEVGGPNCYSGYVRPSGWTGGADGGPPHEPGGTAPCSTCWARSWRQACRDNAAATERARAVAPGTVVRFAEPLDYGKWGVHQVFTFVKGTTFAADGLRFSVPGWQARAWEPVQAS